MQWECKKKEYIFVNSVPKRIIKLRLSAMEILRIYYVTSQIHSLKKIKQAK